jgi:hypothetical protein
VLSAVNHHFFSENERLRDQDVGHKSPSQSVDWNGSIRGERKDQGRSGIRAKGSVTFQERDQREGE